jgi:3-oxoacyl-[acyl-carrier protein] reductase
MPAELEGKTALVCGSTNGIGRTVAERFARAGADVVINGRNRAAGEEAVSAVEALGRKAMFMKADLLDHSQVRVMVEETLARWGRIDILVANGAAVYPPPKFFHETDPGIYADYMHAYMFTRLYPINAVLGHMKERRQGKIIITTSDAGRTPTPGESLIGAASAGIVMATKVMAKEFSRWKINVNTVGITVTEDTPAYEQNVRPEGPVGGVFRKAVERTPFWPITAEDVSALILFLAGGGSDRITGQTFSVNGGLSFPG